MNTLKNPNEYIYVSVETPLRLRIIKLYFHKHFRFIEMYYGMYNGG